LSGKLVEIHRIADEALDMVQEMKDKARKGLLEPVDIKAIITTALTEVAIPANISVEDVTDTYVNLPPVRANLTLTKVFRNLIANAVDAMPNGGKITLGVKEVDNQWIEAFVEDNGVGIPEDWREEIFDILSVFSKKRPEQRGHGLGLWYSRAYVEACGGQFPPPESMVREGTRFTIRLQVWKP
jgi:signal transduction histidine kinase